MRTLKSVPAVFEVAVDSAPYHSCSRWRHVASPTLQGSGHWGHTQGALSAS